MTSPRFVRRPRSLIFTIAAGVGLSLMAARAEAESLILVEVESGKVLHAENAAHPWYPASITKIMTTYVTLRAIKEGRLTFDTLLPVSHNAVAQQPVKMGFPVGTQITVDNALKMLLVKSANDIAVVIAEGVGGSIEGFADLMNQNARRLGMVQSHWVNPNGLPADEQVTSARDMAILARAALREFPEYDYLWHLPGIRFGKKVQRNYNTLIGRYPGADGMKTGFICASGFNLVATATRDNKRLIAIVLGAPSSAARAIKAAGLLERGFASNPLAWLTPSLGTVEALQPVNADPPNLREEVCGTGRKRPAAEDEDDSAALANISSDSAYSVFLSSLRIPTGKHGNLLQNLPTGEPVTVFTGPARRPGATAVAEGKPGKGGAKIAAAPAAIRPAAASSGAGAVLGAVPWTSLSPTGLAEHPPAELAIIPAGVTDSVPLPRSRPKAISAQKTAGMARPSQPQAQPQPQKKR
jgi:D-alanyl-D-alanine carboxypeptidase